MRTQLMVCCLSAVISCQAAERADAAGFQDSGCVELLAKAVAATSNGRLADAESILSGLLNAEHFGSDARCAWLSLHNLASVRVLAGQLPEAEALELRALSLMDRTLASTDPARFRPLHLLWSVRYRQGRRGKARETFNAMRLIPIEAPLDRAVLCAAAAAQFQSEGRLRDAEPEFLKSLAAWEQAGGGETAEFAMMLSGLGTLYVAQRRHEEAASSLNRALRIVDSSRQTVPTDRIMILQARAALRANQRNWQAAVADVRSAISIAELETRLGPAEIEPMLANLAYLLRKAHQVREARAVEERARSIGASLIRDSVVDVSDFPDARNRRK